MKRMVKSVLSVIMAAAMIVSTACVDVYALEPDSDEITAEESFDADILTSDMQALSDNSLSDESMSDNELTDKSVSDNVLPDEGDGSGWRGGYIEIPGERNVPKLSDDVSYADIKNALKYGDKYIEIPDEGYSITDSAYPYSYNDSFMLLEWLKEHYPATRDQGSEGACWAFSTIGTTEFYGITHGTVDKSVDHSELHLAYWTYADEGTGSPVAGDTGDRVHFDITKTPVDAYGRHADIIGYGGNTVYGVQTLMQRRGIADESVANYEKKAGLIHEPHSTLMEDTERDNTAYLKNAYMINKDNIELIKQTLLANGGLGVSFNAQDQYTNYATAAVCHPSNWDGGVNHAVMIVGWDDDYPISNFGTCKPSRSGAWLCRNSWTTVPDINDYDSYFWISYEDGSIPCVWALETMEDTDPSFDNAYFYDSSMHDELRFGGGTKKTANIYRASSGCDSELLEAVSFATDYSISNVGYTIEVYTDVDPAAGPESGTLQTAATTSGTLTLGGTYTITLDEPVELTGGEYFAVAVSLDNGQSVIVEADFNSAGWPGITSEVGAKKGQSFRKSGSTWTDIGLSEGGNAIIHALTSNGNMGEICEVYLNCNGGMLKYKDKNGKVSYPGEVRYTVGKNRIFKLPVPSKYGCTFAGWKSLTDGETYSDAYTVTEDIGFEAQWVIPKAENVSVKGSPEREGGIIYVGDKLVMSSETKDSRIYYAIQDDEPSDESEWTLYTDPVPVKRGMEGNIRVWTYAAGNAYEDSDVSNTDLQVVRNNDSIWGGITDPDDRDLCGTDEDGYPIIPKGIWLSEASYEAEPAYTGSEITVPDLRIYNGNNLLTTGRDYTVSYKNNKNISGKKKASFTVKFKGNSSGTVSRNFTIVPASLKTKFDGKEGVTPKAVEAGFTGNAITPEFAFRWNDIPLILQTDYSMSYYREDDFTDEENPGEPVYSITEPGNYKILLTGKGSFTGQEVISLAVVGKTPISDAVLSGFESKVEIPANPLKGAEQPFEGGLTSLIYNGETLAYGIDYEVKYFDNFAPGTATAVITGIGDDFAGTYTKTFKVTAIPLTSDFIEPGTFASDVVPDMDMIKEHKAVQRIVLKYDDPLNGAYELVEGSDYKVTYKKNTKPGKATMKVTGLGRFKGSFSEKFKITARNITAYDSPVYVGIEKYNEWIRIGDGYYGGLWDAEYRSGGAVVDAELRYGGPDDQYNYVYTYSDGDEYAVLENGRDYSVKYKNNKKYTIVIKGNYYSYTTPTVTYTGKGLLKGKVTYKFNFSTGKLGSGTVSIKADDLVRSGKKKGLFSKPVLKDNGRKLKAGKEYSKKYVYTYVTDAWLANGAIKQAGERVENSDILKAGTDATIKVTVSGQRNYGKVKKRIGCWVITFTSVDFRNSYEGTISTTYQVKAGVMNKAKVTINKGKAYTFTGSAIEPGKDAMVVKVGKVTLKPEDYEIVGYSNNVNKGTAKVTLRGRGKYGGEKTFR